MIARIKTIAQSPAISKTIIVTVGTFTGSIFAYLLQVFLGRELSIEAFGLFTALLSVYVILGVLMVTFSTSLIKLVSKLMGEGKFDVLTHLFVKLTIGVLVFGTFLYFGIISLSNPLSTFLNISLPSVFTYFAAFVVLSFLIILPSAYLQGLLRFKAFSFLSAFGQFLRLAFPVTALRLGYGIEGVFLGMGLSYIVSYLVGVLILRKNFVSFKENKLRPHFEKFLAFAWAVLFVQVGMTLLNNVDIILVKHFFDDHTSGIYAGLITIGKILLFGASTVGVVMFPMVSSAHDKGEDYMEKFKILLILQVFVVAVGIVVFTAFPDLISKKMFGDAYSASAQFLPKFSLFVGAYVIINFMTLFLLAINKVKVFLFFIPAIIAQIALISVFHDSIVSIVNVNLAVSASLLFGVVLYFLKNVGISNSSGVQAGSDN